MSNIIERVERPLTDAAVQDEIRRLTRRSFATGAFAALLSGGAATWVATRTAEDGIPWPLRRMLAI